MAVDAWMAGIGLGSPGGSRVGARSWLEVASPANEAE
jgi:hypothetical protein